MSRWPAVLAAARAGHGWWAKSGLVLDSTTAPWVVPYQRLERARVGLVHDLDSGWSSAATADYARARGVPAANLLGYHLGGDDERVNFADAVACRTYVRAARDHIANRGLDAIIMGPGTPRRVDIANTAGSGQGAPLSSLTANAPGVADLLLSITGSGDGWLFTNGVLNVDAAYPYWALTGNAADLQGLSPRLVCPSYSQVGANWMLSTPESTAMIGGASRIKIIGGRVGICGWNNPVTENEATVRAMIDRVTALESFPRNAYRQPIFVHIGATPGWQARNFAAIARLLMDWGLNVKYLVRPTAEPEVQSLTPTSGGVGYTAADVIAGTVPPDPHYLRLGWMDNGEALNANVRATWRPLPGALSLVGPSEGGFYSATDSIDGGVGGVWCPAHPYDGEPQALIGAAMHMLQGMSIAEAMFYSGSAFRGFQAGGDPLFCPFPRQ